MGKRFEEFKRRLTGLRGYVDRGFNHVETGIRGLGSGLNRGFPWLLGILISMWVAIIAAVPLEWRAERSGCPA